MTEEEFRQTFFEKLATTLIESYYVAIEINREKQYLIISNISKEKFPFECFFKNKKLDKNILGSIIINYLATNFNSSLMPKYQNQLKKELSGLNIFDLEEKFTDRKKIQDRIKRLKEIKNRQYLYSEKIFKYSLDIEDNVNINEESQIKKYNNEIKKLDIILDLIFSEMSKTLINLQLKDNIKLKDLEIQSGTNDNLLIIKNSKKIYIKVVTSIYDFLEKEEEKRVAYFNNTSKLNLPNQLYYRGNKVNFDLSTSLFRDEKDTELEHEINNRIIQSMPNDFNDCETFFDKLTILKHFNCPSRLLDITRSPLIAAFFALDNYYKQDAAKVGQIHCCFPNDSKKIKNSKNSDSVSLLSALCTTDKNYIESFEYFITYIDNFTNYLEKSQILENDQEINKSEFNRCKKYVDTISNEIQKIKVIFFQFYYPNYVEIEELTDKLVYFGALNDFKMEYPIAKDDLKFVFHECLDLKNVVSQKKQFFNELHHQALLINPCLNIFKPGKEDIDTYYIVHPSLNNIRIINQQGLFVLIGSKPNSRNLFLNHNTEYKELFETKYITNGKKLESKRLVYIIENFDNKFYEDLSKIHGINKGYIYPELERKVTQIKEDVRCEHKNFCLNKPFS